VKKARRNLVLSALAKRPSWLLAVPALAWSAVLWVGSLSFPGCASGPTTSSLSFAQMQSMNPGVPADWVMEEYPFGRAERGADGRVRTIRLPVTDPQGKSHSVTLLFDANEVLAEKRYSGPIVRPPPMREP
jgi:hypothetical protein